MLGNMDSILADLSMKFATEVIILCDNIKNRAHIKNQILRSSCSIGANIHEARYAYSRNDFTCKLQIALKECNETIYWLELLKNTFTISEEQFQVLKNSCTRIRYMLIKSLNTAKNNDNAN